jgi:hypothetical protein
MRYPSAFCTVSLHLPALLSPVCWTQTTLTNPHTFISAPECMHIVLRFLHDLKTERRDESCHCVSRYPYHRLAAGLGRPFTSSTGRICGLECHVLDRFDRRTVGCTIYVPEKNKLLLRFQIIVLLNVVFTRNVSIITSVVGRVWPNVTVTGPCDSGRHTTA